MGYRPAMADKPKGRGLGTLLVHAGERAVALRARPTVTPIYGTSTYLYPTAKELDQAFADGNQPVYSRHGNPTLDQLEGALSAVEAGKGAVAYGSGMAAIYAAILAAGTPKGESVPAVRRILAANDLYGATLRLLDEQFRAQGAEVKFTDVCDLDRVQCDLESLRPEVVFFEQISNPCLRIVDVETVVRLAHAVGARVVVDNTFATPILERPLGLGADLVVHSATKFIAGHGDVTAGAVVARTSMVLDVLRHQARLLGAILGPFEASLVARGLKTLELRIQRQCFNAAALAGWLSEQPKIARVLYPGLESHPQHLLAKERFGGLFGALVAVELDVTGREQIFRFLDALGLVLPATTLGDIYTLITAPFISSHRELSSEQRRELGISDSLLRFSVGIEELSDIQNDLAQALEAISGTHT